MLEESTIPEIANHRCWVISDTHFSHANIARYCGRPADHEKQMIDNWRQLVKPRDLVLHLGDLALGRPAQMEEIALKLPGRKVIIRGNHDKKSKAWYKQLGFQIIDAFTTTFEGYTVSWTHYPGGKLNGNPEALVLWPKHLNVCGHVHNRSHTNPYIINMSVEVNDYKPVWAQTMLAENIARLHKLK
jgi:calcineurin-like phosphoesterase family protein